MIPRSRSLHLVRQSTLVLIVTATYLSSGVVQARVQPNPVPTLTSIPSEDDGYLLDAGDRVRIDFFSVPEFTNDYQVLPNGTVNFPQVGAVLVRGRTLKQAAATISARFDAILTRPVVTVSLTGARPVTVAIAGEVNRPGSYAVPAEGGIPRLTRVLQLAEGVTQSADIDRVQIRRPRPFGQGADELITVSLGQLLQTGDVRQDLRLRDGDSILIPTSSNVDLNAMRQLAAANFATTATRPIKIAVVGEVNRPGPYTLAQASGGQVNPSTLQANSVTRAIQTAGGITQTADVRNIQVRRMTQSGAIQTINVDFWKLLASGDLRQDVPLQEGDTIEIPTATSLNDQEATRIAAASFSTNQININVVGEVGRPGTVAISPNAPLNQGLLAAGGFNDRARKGSVTLIRLNPNGTVTKRDISVDFAQGLNEQNNPALRNNDTLVVRKSALAGISTTIGAILSPFSSLLGVFRLFGL
ncbi:SLBB domain-containing protein [Phormidesmis priestleyi]|uniref:SLBB domain-containing protein n=1 Tax=Phormidesmis priestleyi TaxID=268141 RepID=UPI00083A6F09|nr:SLBB domain-containing protein [Phormidesmis priestleyi]